MSRAIDSALRDLTEWRDRGTSPDANYCAGNQRFGDDVILLLGEVEHLRELLLTGLALHGGEAHTHSEKEWRAEARAALGIRTQGMPDMPNDAPDKAKLIRVMEDVHASLCQEVESLMGAEAGTPEAARLDLWAAHVEKIEEALWGHEFKK